MKFTLLLVLMICLVQAGYIFADTSENVGHDAPKPNIVFIYADDMGYGEVEALNPERCKIPTPSLNRLALEGMVFTDAHTSSSVCTPSRYSLLTGRYNWRTRMQKGVLKDGGEPLIAKDRMTLGHIFRDQGYNTAIFGKWHLGYQYEKYESTLSKAHIKKQSLAAAPLGTRIPDGPVTRGFDHFYGFHHARSMGSIVRDDVIVEEIDVVEVLPSLTREATDYIDKNASEAKNGKPFFLYFPLSSPHTPIVPAEAWVGKTELGSYGDFVAQTDGSVGEIMEALDRNGLSENTILIFSADNGTSQAAGLARLEKMGHYPSANMRGAKADLWDGGHRVPFILRWPGHVKAGTQSDQLICMSDMMATFAALFSVELDDASGEDSISFLPALYGKIIEGPRQNIVHHSISGYFSVRQGDWKLLLAPGSGGRTQPKGRAALKAGLPEMQLYNMSDDIGEENNLMAEYPEKVESLIQLLEDIVSDGRSTPGIAQKNDAEIDIIKKFTNT